MPDSVAGKDDGTGPVTPDRYRPLENIIHGTSYEGNDYITEAGEPTNAEPVVATLEANNIEPLSKSHQLIVTLGVIPEPVAAGIVIVSALTTSALKRSNPEDEKVGTTAGDIGP